ncbi:MAG: amidohydrolase [Gammaproteobacteria bacterium]|nr:amidohydrolase [Gammaproteobacteria bacterium]
MNNNTHGLEKDIARKMTAVRRSIHSNPELSHEETATAALVRHELEQAGITDIEPVYETGLVATINGKHNGKTIALRGDLDALPLTERTELPFASTKPGVMHACGHDAHTAMVFATALTLHRERNTLRGTVRCIFQPAEECEPLGGREVVRAGKIQGVDGVIGMHVDPALDVGKIAVREGAVNASADEFAIRIQGKSSHGAKPHLGVDTISVAAALIQELQKIPSRRIDPFTPALITVGKIEGGSAANIIAEDVTLHGILRTMDESARDAMRNMVREISDGVVGAHGASAEVSITEGEPVLRNDPHMTKLIREVGLELLGPECVELATPSLGSDDFAFYAEQAPAVYFRLGVRNQKKGYVHPLHHPQFAIDENALDVGATVLIRAARRFLQR